MTRSWFVYILECMDGSLYTGIAVDPAARFEAHRNGTGARYTRSHPPRCLLAAKECANRSEASSAEYRIKRLAPSEKRAWALANKIVAMT